MFDEALLRTALADVGYRRLKRYVYRAEWSTSEVEHFLYFQRYGAPIGTAKNFLTAHFGMRNRDAQNFAHNSIKLYGPPIFKLMMRDDDHNACSMIFSLGKLGAWGIRSSLDLRQFSDAELAQKMRADIQQYLFPRIWNVTDIEALISFLSSNVEPCSWIYVNGAIRAAMIIRLSIQIGKKPAQIRDTLQPYHKRIMFALNDAPNSDPDTFIEKIIEDAIAETGRTLKSYQ